MKKLLAAATLLLCLNQTASAQIDIHYGVEVGLKSTTIGIKVPDYYGGGSTSVPTTFKRGGEIGGFAEFAFGEHYAAQGGLYLSGKGADGYGITYLEIPLTLVKKFGRRHGFLIYAGPYFGFAVGTSGDITIGKPETGSSTLGINAFDFGAKAGLGYQLRNGFFARAGYEIGFTNIASTNMDGEKINNDGFSIGIGYIFHGRFDDMY